MHLSWTEIWSVTGGAIAVGTFAILVWQQFRVIRRQNAEQLAKQEEQRRRDEEFKVDWNGRPARPGVSPVPGMMERMQRIEQNTSSLPDRMTAIEHRMDLSEADRAEIRTRLDDHIKMHAGGFQP